MHKKLIPYFLLCLLLLSCGDNNSSVFEKDISELLNYYNTGNWNGIADMVYPEFFRAVRKEQFINSLRTLDSLGVKRTFLFKSIEKTSAPFAEGDKLFCRVYYTTEITVTLSRQLEQQAEHFKEEFEENYGKENLSFDTSTLTFTISAHQSVIAVTQKESGLWKYMELNNEHSFDIVGQVVPPGIMNELTGSK